MTNEAANDDRDYIQRLFQHMAVLVAYEDSSLAHDVDRVMLAIVFLRNHCDMLAAEVGRLDKDGNIG